jgi:hypothetical protein
VTCPACGRPLYGWVKLDDRSTGTSYVVDRCEECGLGVTRGVPEPEAVFESARRGLRPGATIEMRVPNRASWQAGIGGDRWGALELPTQRLHLTPRSLGLLLRRHGLEAVQARQPAFGRNQLWMWQTLLNGFTFNTNFARDVARRRLRPGTARGWPSFVIDAVVTTLAALPIAVIAVPLELLAVAFRRGGEIVFSVGLGDAEPADAPLYDRSHGS